MTRRARTLAYGGAATLIIAGVVCAAVISGGAGPLVAIGLVGLGLIAVISLVFLEIGLSEDRARAQTTERERIRSGPQVSRPAGAPSRRTLRPERMRGRRRRLR